MVYELKSAVSCYSRKFDTAISTYCMKAHGCVCMYVYVHASMYIHCSYIHIYVHVHMHAVYIGHIQ